jgi:hypothetical protein
VSALLTDYHIKPFVILPTVAAKPLALKLASKASFEFLWVSRLQPSVALKDLFAKRQIRSLPVHRFYRFILPHRHNDF